MSELEVFNDQQNSPEWLMRRLGLPTASVFDTIMAKWRDGGPSKTRRTLLYKLAGETITGLPSENYQNASMERGHEWEPEARNLYAMITGNQPVQVGFLRRGDVGCSPDSLLGNDGMLEIKTKAAHLQIEILDDATVPTEHVPQLQGQLWVSARNWVDLICYSRGLPPFIKRVYRDENTIAKIKVSVDQFWGELQALVAKVRAMQT